MDLSAPRRNNGIFLSPGDDAAIRINPGIVDSNIGLFSFPVANSYKFGDEGEIVGFDFRYKTVANDASTGVNTIQGDKSFGLYDVYLMANGNEYIGDEGDVKQLAEDNTYTLSGNVAQGNPFYPMDISTFLTSMDYAYPSYMGFHENFEGQSDVDVELETSHGAVRKKGDPYLDLDRAHKSMPKQAAGVRLAKNELSLFYGSDFKGSRIIKIKRNGKRWGPKTFRGEKGGKDTLGAMFGGGVAADTSINVNAEAAAQYNKTNKNFTGQGYAGAGGKWTNKFNKFTGGRFATGTGAGSVPRGRSLITGGKVGLKQGVKRVPIVGSVITAAFAIHDGKKRAQKVSAALASGDASGISTATGDRRRPGRTD